MSEDLVVLREILQRELETINAYEKMLERVSDPALREIIDHVTGVAWATTRPGAGVDRLPGSPGSVRQHPPGFRHPGFLGRCEGAAYTRRRLLVACRSPLWIGSARNPDIPTRLLRFGVAQYVLP